ncbi:hypothetical protein [Hydrotalea sp.]|uniref:hypothetical protein n=1 Tax=Hydrotalea sp. TaxID=2881279 RepID=UPI0025832548|nr:hypothetical protein [Hydrotalea sp.]
MEEKQKFIQLNTDKGKFVLINPSSIASIEQTETHLVTVTMKEIKNGNNISFQCNYDLATILRLLNQ